MTESIENVIMRNLNAIQEFQIIQKVEKHLSGIYLEKLQKNLNKNSNIRIFVEGIKNNFKSDSTLLFSPITTIDVERSFSKFKYLLMKGLVWKKKIYKNLVLIMSIIFYKL